MRWCSLSFGLRPNRVPRALAALRPFVGALDDALAFIFGQSAQEGDDALDDMDPSSIDWVARSHSASTSTSPFPSWSMAFSSWGRFLMSLPLRDGLHGGLVWAVGVVIGAALFLSTAGGYVSGHMFRQRPPGACPDQTPPQLLRRDLRAERSQAHPIR